MGFDALVRKVSQAEQALEIRERRTGEHWRQLKATWRASWTPTRIVLAGLTSGYLAGRAKPFKFAGSGGLLNLLTALSGLMADSSAQQAADEAEAAAEAAHRANGSDTVAGPAAAVDPATNAQ